MTPEVGYSPHDPEPSRPLTFRVEVEPITFHTLGGPAPDPDWVFTDRAGHRHVWSDHDRGTGTVGKALPTLRWVVDERYWCEECRDEHEEGHHECRQCGEVIEPGTIHKGPETITRPGRRTYYINDVPVTEEEARAAWERSRYDK